MRDRQASGSMLDHDVGDSECPRHESTDDVRVHFVSHEQARMGPSRELDCAGDPAHVEAATQVRRVSGDACGADLVEEPATPCKRHNMRYEPSGAEAWKQQRPLPLSTASVELRAHEEDGGTSAHLADRSSS